MAQEVAKLKKLNKEVESRCVISKGLDAKEEEFKPSKDGVVVFEVRLVLKNIFLGKKISATCLKTSEIMLKPAEGGKKNLTFFTRLRQLF